MAIKSLEEIQERKAFITEADTSTQAFVLEQSFKDLKRMELEDLVDRLEQVENQATLIKWRIWWAIRQKFPSDKLFGQYVNELRSTHASLVSSQQHINLCINAGKFCEKHKITDLTKIGISPTGIFELARPVNEEVATAVFNEVKKKGYKVEEIQRRIAQAKSIPEQIDYNQPEEPEQRGSKGRYEVPVIDGIAIVSQPPQQPEIEREVAENAILEQGVVKQFVYPKHEHKEVEQSQDDEVIGAILAFIDQYQLSPLKMIGLLQGVIQRLRDRMY